MTWKRIIDVHDSHIIIDLPESFNQKKVLIVVEDITSSKEAKMQLMQQASNDPLFLADIQEVLSDFGPIDHETM